MVSEASFWFYFWVFPSINRYDVEVHCWQNCKYIKLILPSFLVLYMHTSNCLIVCWGPWNCFWSGAFRFILHIWSKKQLPGNHTIPDSAIITITLLYCIPFTPKTILLSQTFSNNYFVRNTNKELEIEQGAKKPFFLSLW